METNFKDPIELKLHLLNKYGISDEPKIIDFCREAYNTLDKQLQFVTSENESLRKANNRLSEQINGYKVRQKASDGVQKILNSLRKKYDKVCQENRHLEKGIERLKNYRV